MPPEEAWKEWRYMLAVTYFGGTRTDEMDSDDYPLYRTTIEYDKPVQNKSTWPPPSQEMTLSEIIEFMPPVWQQILGHCEYPLDEGEQIASVLHQGNTVKAWSDGTEDAGVGAHAHMLQPQCRGSDNAFKGDNGTLGHPDSIASNWTESFGAASILLVALAIEFKYDVQEGGYLLLHIDNMEVVNQIKFGMDRAMNSDKHLKTDYDIWKESVHIMSMLKTAVCAKWVKGHHDLLKKQGNVGPMPMEAHYNIEMDARAGLRGRQCTTTPMLIPMTTDLASLMLNGCYMITADIVQHITSDSTKPGL